MERPRLKMRVGEMIPPPEPELGAGLEMTLQVARGFRDPLLSDRYYRGITGRGFITGNPELEPETSRQLDLAVRWRRDRLAVAGYVYGYRIQNLIERYRVDGDFFFRNRGAGEIAGLELEAASTGENLALALREAGRLEEAEALLEESRDLHRRRFGEDDPRTLRSLGNLAQLRLDQGRPEEAESLARQTLAGQVRFTTTGLGTLEAKIASAADRALGIELDASSPAVAVAKAARSAAVVLVSSPPIVWRMSTLSVRSCSAATSVFGWPSRQWMSSLPSNSP